MIVISSILSVLNVIWPYAVAILVFILLVIIHEAGHFTASKALGIKVNEFAVGMGPRIFSKKWGETTYRFNAIPFGGYCALEGEEGQSGDKRAFCNAAAWKRFIVIIAGGAFNVILGFLLVAAMLVGEDYLATNEVAKFEKGATTQKSGLQVGDEIVEVNGRRVYTTYDLTYTFTNVKGNTANMVVKRDGKKVKLQNVTFKTEEYEGINHLMMDFWILGVKNTPGRFVKETFKTTVSYARIIWLSLIDLITGKYGVSALSGPVGVAKVMGDAVKQNGLETLMPVMTLITVNLGLFNLLPLPALDGGRLMFIVAEMITRRKIPPKYEGVIHAVGFILIMLFIFAITAKDIWMLVA